MFFSIFFKRMQDLVNKYLFCRRSLVLCFLFWIILQIIWIETYKIDFMFGDSGLFEYWAKECYEAGTMYPNYNHYNMEYISALGWVNILILWLHFFPDFTFIPYLLMFFTTCSLLLLISITKYINNNRTVCYMVAYTYMILPNFWTTTIAPYTEHSYVFFALLSVWFLLKTSNWSLISSGIAIAIAFWIRPIAEAWIISSIIFIFLTYRSYRRIALYLLTCVVSCSIIGLLSHQNFPDYPFKSSTGGVTLLIGANDDANGGYEGTIAREKGKIGYIADKYEGQRLPVYETQNDTIRMLRLDKEYSYAQCDSIYKDIAINWIKENPLKWISLLPAKIKLLWFSGSFVVIPAGYTGSNWMVHFLFSFQYYAGILIFLIALLGLLLPFWRNRKFLLVLVPIIICSGMTFVIHANPRFNFIFYNFVILFACQTIYECYKLICKRINKNKTN